MTWGWDWLRKLLGSRCDWIGHARLILSNEKQDRRFVGRKRVVTRTWEESCPRCGKRWRCGQTDGLLSGPGKVTRTEVPTW